jgi:hypothetical protein
MRWDKLFDDLESQLEQEISAEETDIEAEEERLRLGRLTVRERVTAIRDAGVTGGERTPVAVTLLDGVRLQVHPVTIGRDWFSADIVGETERRTQCIVPLAGVAGLSLTSAQVTASLAPRGAAVDHPSLPERLGLSFVLRDLCRRRRALDLVLVTGRLHGTIDRVGRDHVDLAIHERGVVRRESAVQETRIVPLASVVLVRL